MSEEKYDAFEKEMLESFPKMFSRPFGGFAIGEGWWPIIRALCNNIQGHIDWHNEQAIKYGRGEVIEQVVVVQIKEKFGGLRFYYNGGDDVVSGMVRMAESWAGHTCERCGSPGERQGDHNGWVWLKTLCHRHHQDYLSDKERAMSAGSQ